MKKRYFPKRDKRLPQGFDSWLEYDLHQGPLKEAVHHPPKDHLIKYSVPHTYALDFMFEYNNCLFLCESKGRFRDSSESRKYLYIRDYLEDWHVFKQSHCEHIELFFIFENSLIAMPFAKKRKDGSKNNHGEWAEKSKFRFLCRKRGDLEDIKTNKDLIEKLDKMN